jgi:hypothetical protein
MKMTTRSGEECASQENMDLNSSIRELLVEMREQKREISSLKEEVRGNSLSVRSEVKKLKTEHELKWRYESNKIQHDFNSELHENISQVLWAFENNKQEYARELVNDACEQLKRRNKLIRIADTSEGGWETVRQYEANPVASDSSDESRINRAEARAAKKKKAKSKKSVKPSATVTSGSLPRGGNTFSFPAQQQRSESMQQLNTFRPHYFKGNARDGIGPCFACGETTHLRRHCPYTRRIPQLDVPTKQ